MPASDWFAEVFRRNANGLAARIGGPVFLVGSALTSDTPRDLDIRVLPSDGDFARLFGAAAIKPYTVDGKYPCDYEDWEWRRARENLKQSRIMSYRMNRNVDVQIQRADEAARYADSPRLRLDSAPEAFFDGNGETI